MKTKGLALLIAAVSALALVAGAGAKQQSHKATTITGAGSTFVSPLVSVWTPAIGSAFDYTVQYSAVGSGAGISAISSRQVDFGAWPCVSAQNTIFRSSADFDDLSGRMMYV